MKLSVRLVLICACLIGFGGVATPARAQTYAIQASLPWQSTGYAATAGEPLRVRVDSGLWTSQEGVVAPNPGVGTYACGSPSCVEPLPYAPIGALIARVGGQLYHIGAQATITPAQAGVVELRINDADEGLYDNAGTLQIAVEPTGPNIGAVAANQGWQPAGLLVYPGQTVRVEVRSGLWTHWQGAVALNPGSGTTPCTAGLSCVEPLPAAPVGALIARVGGQLYHVGPGATFAVTRGGALDLRINDGDNGLSDNAGSLQVYATASGVAPAPSVRRVSVLVFDPILNSGQRLSARMGWDRHEELTAQTVEFFRTASRGQLQYEVVETNVRDHWPVLLDGYRYSEADWFTAVNSGGSVVPSRAMVDYAAFLNDPTLDLCGKRNRDEIHELWVYNGPYFGFWESTLAGPAGQTYFLNSSPVDRPHGCQKLLVIMGPSPERNVGSVIHNFGHRMESTMTRLYGSWVQNRTAHAWERFALTRALSPSYTYSGCGNIHYPPNTSAEYRNDDPAQAPSNCDDFVNYPNTLAPQSALRAVSCADWGCDEVGHYRYWFGRLPIAAGCTDGKLNNWWHYLADPLLAAQSPHSAQFCASATTTVTPTGTATATRTSTPSSTSTSAAPTSTPTSTSATPSSTATTTGTSATPTATPGRDSDVIYLPLLTAP